MSSRDSRLRRMAAAGRKGIASEQVSATNSATFSLRKSPLPLVGNGSGGRVTPRSDRPLADITAPYRRCHHGSCANRRSVARGGSNPTREAKEATREFGVHRLPRAPRSDLRQEARCLNLDQGLGTMDSFSRSRVWTSSKPLQGLVKVNRGACSAGVSWALPALRTSVPDRRPVPLYGVARRWGVVGIALQQALDRFLEASEV
jgi:hypothetical protein